MHGKSTTMLPHSTAGMGDSFFYGEKAQERRASGNNIREKEKRLSEREKRASENGRTRASATATQNAKCWCQMQINPCSHTQHRTPACASEGSPFDALWIFNDAILLFKGEKERRETIGCFCQINNTFFGPLC
jgi:hypothetical protein